MNIFKKIKQFFCNHSRTYKKPGYTKYYMGLRIQEKGNEDKTFTIVEDDIFCLKCHKWLHRKTYGLQEI